MERLYTICQSNHITLEQLAEIAQVQVPMFEAYTTGELPLDDPTLHRIYEFDPRIDWMWLEHGYDPEDLKVIGDGERLDSQNEC